MDATANVDRAKGDIHPQGNPHIQVDPHNITAVARALSARLSLINPINTKSYEENLNKFLTRWQDSISRWEAEAMSLRGKRAITHHKSWVYLLRWLGIEEVANLEAVPGLGTRLEPHRKLHLLLGREQRVAAKVVQVEPDRVRDRDL